MTEDIGTIWAPGEMSPGLQPLAVATVLTALRQAVISLFSR